MFAYNSTMNVLRILIFILFWSFHSYGQNSSQLIYLDQGELTYVPFAMTGQTNEVNIIPDFSFAGFMGGGVALPTNIPVKQTIEPEEGDDARRIQDAINLVEALEPDQNGFRGVILIKAGHYSLDNILAIRKSGVVLKGEGQGLNGTVLHANPRVNHNVISILGSGGITIDSETEQTIITDYVPVGTYSFEVEDVSNFEIGDNIVVTRTPNQAWIDKLGMDQETLCGGESDCVGWTPGSYTIDHERIITAINGNAITINIPIVDVMEEQYGGGTISKIKSTKRISQCGIENMRVQSFYDGNSDESHAWTAVRLKDSENCWVKNITGQFLAYSTVNIESANFTTVQDCAYIDPKSQITGGRRYSFAIQEGLGNLFQRCYATSGRHDFITGSRVTGPNVFLDGLAESANSDIGPHHRWATGILFDNIKAGSTRVWNRGSSGTGHGWAGAQTMFWNIKSYKGEFRVDSPHGSMNWGIGCLGTDQTGDGYWESWGNHVLPRSLYLQQLKDRLGDINNVIIAEQQSEEIIDLLTSWRGQGDFSEGGFQGEIPNVSFIFPSNEIDVSTWEGGDILVDATDSDGTIQSVKLLINGELIATDNESPYVFNNATSIIQNLSHEVHYLQVIATDNDGNTNFTRKAIIGGDPPPPPPPPTIEVPSEIKVYPNPTQNDKLSIEMKEDAVYSVRLFNLQGKKVDHLKFEGTEYLYNCENISEGIYILEIQNKEEVLVKAKIMIQ